MFYTERDIQADVIALYETVGGYVSVTSVGKRSVIRPAGFPDLVVLLPRGKGTLYHEVKTVGGRQSEGQVLFAARARDAGEPYVLGGVSEAREALEGLGLLVG